MYNQTF